MPDLKKTIVELDRITSVMKDSLVLLTEQQGYIDAFNEVNEQNNRLYDKINKLLSEQPQIVLCRDCKDACIYSDDWVICTHIDSNGNDKHPVDWFCADGEAKNDREDSESL